MGKYINQNSKGEILPALGKAKALLDDGGTLVDGNTFVENMVCVVGNVIFDAALYTDKSEYDYVKRNPDSRPKKWIIYPYAKDLAK